MNLKVLPPKRFQDPGDPYYDPIRHEPWFRKLETRRYKRGNLAAALFYWRAQANDTTQKASSALYGVDPRELRDYANWVEKTPRKAVSGAAQAILDGAYEIYSNPSWPLPHANHPFVFCIRYVASLFGVKGRLIEEMWEIHHDFWPTGYPPHHQ